MMSIGKFVVTGLLAVVGSGCGQKGGATCEDAVVHLDTIAGEKLPAEYTAERIAKCKTDNTPPELLACIVAAKTEVDLKACKDKLPVAEVKKYANKTKTTEAVINLERMYDGARACTTTTRPPEAGSAIPVKQLPASVGPTPPLGECCKNDTHRCEPSAALWTSPSWQALMFSVDDPSYYSYQLTSSGTGADATFKVNAYGDLDCNGTYSTFEMTGKVGADGSVIPPGEMKKVNELE